MMVFARSKTRLRNLPTFKFGNLDLDLVDDYVYLGICFNWNGSFVKAKIQKIPSNAHPSHAIPLYHFTIHNI